MGAVKEKLTSIVVKHCAGKNQKEIESMVEEMTEWVDGKIKYEVAKAVDKIEFSRVLTELNEKASEKRKLLGK